MRGRLHLVLQIGDVLFIDLKDVIGKPVAQENHDIQGQICLSRAAFLVELEDLGSEGIVPFLVVSKLWIVSVAQRSFFDAEVVFCVLKQIGGYCAHTVTAFALRHGFVKVINKVEEHFVLIVELLNTHTVRIVPGK